MNQLESTFQKLAAEEARLREARRRKRHEKMAPKINQPFRRLPTREQLIERLFSYTDFGQECWQWKGCINGSGYGSFNFAGESLAHRISWILHRGEIPTGMCVLHKCDNPPCINPDHLFIGTHLENMQDCYRKNRWPGRIISDEDREFIYDYHCEAKRKSGTKNAPPGTNSFLAKKYGVNFATIAHLIIDIKKCKLSMNSHAKPAQTEAQLDGMITCEHTTNF